MLGVIKTDIIFYNQLLLLIYKKLIKITKGVIGFYGIMQLKKHTISLKADNKPIPMN